MALVFRSIFALSALVLFSTAAALVFLGGATLVRGEGPIEQRMLDVLGYVVIAIAVFDVAKYLFEEEALRSRERQHISEARRSLTRFVSTIIIAVMLEAIVLVFKVVRGDFAQMIYPVMLLLAGVAMLIGLGVFQALSAPVEQRLAPSDDRRMAADAGVKAGGPD